MHPSMSIDPRLFAPAAARNREPILAALRVHLPPSGTVLEVASGSGEHIVYLAEALPNLMWQPTDLAPERRASIDAWAHAAGLTNVLPALPLDAAAAEWAVTSADVVLCINMIHIAPSAATAGLLTGAASVLPPDGLLALYGPFRRAGQTLEPSNAAFDADLRSRNPDWGLRVLEEVAESAARAGFAAPVVQAMPANNLMVFFRHASR
jgi:cyclopropane fatty-acyl-phospholipid synthase-like methyltransferase